MILKKKKKKKRIDPTNRNLISKYLLDLTYIFLENGMQLFAIYIYIYIYILMRSLFVFLIFSQKEKACIVEREVFWHVLWNVRGK